MGRVLGRVLGRVPGASAAALRPILFDFAAGTTLRSMPTEPGPLGSLLFII